MEVSQDIKEQLKAQRMRQMEAQYYEFSLNKVQYEAIGQLNLVDDMSKKMEDLDKQYSAIKAVDNTPPITDQPIEG